MRLLEHRCFLRVVTRPSAPLLVVPNAELVLKVTHDPHLADDVTIKRHICAFEELDKESRRCR